MKHFSCLAMFAVGSALSLLLFIFLLGIVRWVFSEGPIQQGNLLYVEYEVAEGRNGGFTSVDNPDAVPGGNGSWNDKRYGVLYDEYLVVTKPEENNWGVLVIPSHRLVTVHFQE